MKVESVAILSLCITAALAQVLTVVNGPEPGNWYRMGTEYTLQCQGTPGSDCSIQWTRNEVELVHTSDNIQVTVEDGIARYRCKFVCNNREDEISELVDLSGQNLIRAEILNSGVSGDAWRPLENSVMELTCNYELLSGYIKAIEEPIRPTFTWTSDNRTMGTEESITFVAVPGYDQSIQCQVAYKEERLTSAVVSVQAADEAEAPEVVFMRQGTRVEPSLFITGADYTGYCVSRSHSAGATYQWTKDYFIIPDTPASRIFNLDSVDADSDDGVYRCRMRLQENEYCSRSTGVIEVEAAGRFCQSDGECLAGDAYTQSCKNERCECASGYEPRGEVCAGIAPPLLVSGFLLVCGMILTRLL